MLVEMERQLSGLFHKFSPKRAEIQINGSFL